MPVRVCASSFCTIHKLISIKWINLLKSQPIAHDRLETQKKNKETNGKEMFKALRNHVPLSHSILPTIMLLPFQI